MRSARVYKSHPYITLLWACTRLSSLPDPTKPVWEQDAKILEVLMMVDKEVNSE